VDGLDELAVWLGTCLRGLASWGLGPGTRLAGIGSPSPLHISNQLYAVLLAGQPSAAPRLAVTTPLPEMVDALNAFPPQGLTAYPTVAAALAEEQLQGRLRIAPTLVATTSEVQTADMRRRMTQAWGLEPLDFYGTTEAAVVAAARQGQAGMDILEDLVVVEVVDEHDRPVPPGVAGHKVLPDQPGQPRPAAAALRADRLGHPGRRAQPARAAVRPHRRRRRAQRRPHHPARAGGRPVTVHPFQLRAAGAVPPPIEVTPVPGIERDPGHGAKFKLVRSRPAPSP
jgi:phenylacetate-CoA ligase